MIVIEGSHAAQKHSSKRKAGRPRRSTQKKNYWRNVMQPGHWGLGKGSGGEIDALDGLIAKAADASESVWY